jgi:hypothetical protein
MRLPEVRTVKVLGAVCALASGAVGAVVSCASGGSNELTFFDGGADHRMPPPGGDSGRDAHHSRDTGRDVASERPVGLVDASDASSHLDAGLGVVDAGDATFGVDAGPSFYAEAGTACSPANLVQVQSCGRCGLQTSTCAPLPDGSAPPPSDAGQGDAARHDAGPALAWGPFGECTGQNDAGCVPGTQTVTPCGLCGTQTTVCESDCELGATNCVGEVPDGCVPGAVDFTLVAACSDAGFGGKARTCTAGCTWNAAGCEAPPTTLTISPTAGGTVNTFVNFLTAADDPLVGLSFCPTTLSVGNNTPYAFIQLVNSSATEDVTVSVWTSQVAGQPRIDTAIAYYMTLPINNTQLQDDCVTLVTDSCTPDFTAPTACQASYGGLMIDDAEAVTIYAGSSVMIFVQDQYSDGPDLGIIEVTARTESFL